MTDSDRDDPTPATTAAAPEQPGPRQPGKTTKPRLPMPPTLRGFLGGLAGGVAVLLVGGGGMAALWPTLQAVLLQDEIGRITRLEHGIDDIDARLAAVERELKRAAGEADAAGAALNLEQRVAVLEAQAHAPLGDPRVAAVADRADRLAADVTRLSADVQTLRNAIPPEGTILRLAERAESAEKTARDLAQSHASAQALLLVVGQLREAVNRGDAYTLELQAVRRVADHDDLPQLDALAAFAATGIPRKEILFGQFPSVARDTVQAGLLPDDASLWQRAFKKLSSLVDIRHVDGQGSDTSAVVARAENAVRHDDLPKAVQEMAGLEGRPAEVAASWQKAAAARLAADRALSELTASTAAESAKTGG